MPHFENQSITWYRHLIYTIVQKLEEGQHLAPSLFKTVSREKGLNFSVKHKLVLHTKYGIFGGFFLCAWRESIIQYIGIHFSHILLFYRCLTATRFQIILLICFSKNNKWTKHGIIKHIYKHKFILQDFKYCRLLSSLVIYNLYKLKTLRHINM